MRLFVLGIFALLAISGCTTAPATQESGGIGAGAKATEGPAGAAPSGDAVQGLAFAKSHCAACHDVTGGQVSPNQKSPPFVAIANERGLTGESLSTWLRDSHNYPDLMDFEIEAEHIDNLAAYMLTLQSADYQPPIL